jgi:hypothetical protein
MESVKYDAFGSPMYKQRTEYKTRQAFNSLQKLMYFKNSELANPVKCKATSESTK